MDYKIEKMDGFELIGFIREFQHETSYGEIPKFWDEVMALENPIFQHGPQNEVEKAICDNKIGEFGACFQGFAEGRFFYMIAGIYQGGAVPLGMSTIYVPAASWAKCRATRTMSLRCLSIWNGTPWTAALMLPPVIMKAGSGCRLGGSDWLFWGGQGHGTLVPAADAVGSQLVCHWPTLTPNPPQAFLKKV